MKVTITKNGYQGVFVINTWDDQKSFFYWKQYWYSKYLILTNVFKVKGLKKTELLLSLFVAVYTNIYLRATQKKLMY